MSTNFHLVEGFVLTSIPDKSVCDYVNRYIENEFIPVCRKSKMDENRIDEACRDERRLIYFNLNYLSEKIIDAMIKGKHSIFFPEYGSPGERIANEIFIEEMKKKGYQSKVIEGDDGEESIITIELIHTQ